MRRAVVIAFILWSGMGSPASAAVWPTGEGKAKMMFNLTYYETAYLFDGKGEERKMSSGGVFSKIETNVYLEYGLTDRLSVCANLFAVSQQFKSDTALLTYNGPGDQEICVKYLVGWWPVAVGVQAGAKVPAYTSSADPAPGNRQNDYELRLLLGDAIGKAGFWNLETAYRMREEYPADEIRTDGTLGVKIGKRSEVLFQVNGISGLRNGTHYSTGANPNIDPEYDLYKGSVSYVFHWKFVSLQAAVIRHLAGTNTGAGGGYLFSVWVEF